MIHSRERDFEDSRTWLGALSARKGVVSKSLFCGRVSIIHSLTSAGSMLRYSRLMGRNERSGTCTMVHGLCVRPLVGLMSLQWSMCSMGILLQRTVATLSGVPLGDRSLSREASPRMITCIRAGTHAYVPLVPKTEVWRPAYTFPAALFRSCRPNQ